MAISQSHVQSLLASISAHLSEGILNGRPHLPSRRPQGVHVGPGEGHTPAWTLAGLVDLHLYVSFNPNAYGEVLHTVRDIAILDVHSSAVEVRVPKKVRPLEERSP